MESNSRWLLIMLVVAFALGAAVTLLAPGYRRTAQALASGRPEEAPVWQSNADFYPLVGLKDRSEGERDAR